MPETMPDTAPDPSPPTTPDAVAAARAGETKAAAAHRRPVTPTAPRGPRRSHRGEALLGLAMTTPAVVLLLVFFVVPVALMFGLAFTNARLISPRPA